MASRSHTTFKKRQKEAARLEKRQEKIAKRLQRKLGKGTSDQPEDEIEAVDLEQPEAIEGLPDLLPPPHP
jgi:hypothetical protein